MKNYKNKWTDYDVEKHWDSVADIYVQENEKVSYVHNQRFREALKCLGLKNDYKILNIQSRDGEANKYLSDQCENVEVINVDVSQKLINVAKKKFADKEFIKISTFNNLPFAADSFDRILSLETLEHAENPLYFLRELNRLAKKDAIMVLSCPPAIAEIHYRVYSLLFGGHGEGPHRFLSSGHVFELLDKSNWQLLKFKATLLIPFGPKWLIDLGEKIICRFSKTIISELGIRHFYVCRKKRR